MNYTDYFLAGLASLAGAVPFTTGATGAGAAATADAPTGGEPFDDVHSGADGGHAKQYRRAGELAGGGQEGGESGGGEHEQWPWAQLFARALTVGGGTTQVQRNILAERVLGLPRDEAR